MEIEKGNRCRDDMEEMNERNEMTDKDDMYEMNGMNEMTGKEENCAMKVDGKNVKMTEDQRTEENYGMCMRCKKDRMNGVNGEN